MILLTITPSAIALMSKWVLHLSKGLTLALMAVAMVVIIVVQILVDRRKTQRARDNRDDNNKQSPPTNGCSRC